MRKSICAVAVASTLFASASAEAAGLNDPNCKPTPAHPNPVVFVHGQAGNFEGASALTSSLVSAGYCVYAKNYGKPPGGEFGQEHLSTSAAEIGAQIDEVLARTGAMKVDVVGHSAGVGVLDNFILKRGGAAKVQHAISFGGLHHPYAHGGLPNVLDASIYLPNIIAAARMVVPGITIQDLAKTAVTVFGVDEAMAKTATSNFVADLFDPGYWQDLHGAHSEAPGNFVMVGMSVRSRPTKDAAPNVCYTNIVAIADLLVGPAAGFQDEAPNIENFLLTSAVTQNAHSDMLADAAALQKMHSGLTSTCQPGPMNKQLVMSNDNRVPSADDEAAENAFKTAIANGRDEDEDDDDDARGHAPNFHANAGCSASPSSTSAGIHAMIFAIAGVLSLRRRLSARGREPS
jgi:pimeloyl-ACP methyl ester carboxylesterase